MNYMLRTFLPVALVAALAAGIESCAKSSDNNIIEFETRTDSVGYVVPDLYGDTVYSAAKYSVVWPQKIGRQDFETMRDSLLNLTFNNPGTHSFNTAAKAFMDSALSVLRTPGDTSEFIYSKVPFDTAFNAMRTNITSIKSNVTLLTPRLLVVQVHTDEYTYGAAHGMQTERYLNYSIKDHTLFTVDNTFKKGNARAILDLINQAARKRYPGPSQLFDNPIASFDNFRFTEKSIIFVYQPYDVAPFSTGIVTVSIPAYDLFRFLTPLAQKALALGE